MNISTAKKVGLLLAVVWACTMAYLWFPEAWTRGKKKLADRAGNNSRIAAFLRSNVSDHDLVHVCITSDENTIGGMITLINSIHSNTKHPVMYHLVTDVKSVDHIRQWIDKTKLHDIHYELKAFPEKWVEGKIKLRGGRPELGRSLNYARYYLPRLFPDLKGKFVFIDDDCIVQGDVHELHSMKLKPGHAAAFSQDCSGASKRMTLMKNNFADYIDFKNKHIQATNIKPGTCAFNVGVYVGDMALWREQNITEKLEYWLHLNTKEEVYGNERGGGGSQPPMMIVFHQNYTAIDPDWHVRFLGWTAGTSYTKNFLRHAKLLHWNGRFKPWGRVSSHKDIWDKYFIKDPTGQFHPVRRT